MFDRLPFDLFGVVCSLLQPLRLRRSAHSPLPLRNIHYLQDQTGQLASKHNPRSRERTMAQKRTHARCLPLVWAETYLTNVHTNSRPSQRTSPHYPPPLKRRLRLWVGRGRTLLMSARSYGQVLPTLLTLHHQVVHSFTILARLRISPPISY